MTSLDRDISDQQKRQTGTIKVGGGQIDVWGEYSYSGERNLSSSGAMRKKKSSSNIYQNSGPRSYVSSSKRASNRPPAFTTATGRAPSRPKTGNFATRHIRK